MPFKKSPKYMSMDDYIIPDDEDISYGITVNNKRYEAIFYQHPVELSDTTLILEKIIPILTEKYTPEQLANPTEEIKSEMMKKALEYMIELYTNKTVWFMISDLYGKYYITMFYDNEYNRANGEDL